MSLKNEAKTHESDQVPHVCKAMKDLKTSAGYPSSTMGRTSRAEKFFDATALKNVLGQAPSPTSIAVFLFVRAMRDLNRGYMVHSSR